LSFQSVPNCAVCTINYLISGHEAANVLNFQRAVGYDQSDITDLAALMDDWVNDEVLPLLDNDTSYTNVHVRGLTDINDLEADNNDSAGTGGDAGGTPLPNNVTLALKFNTGLSGRSARGRMFIVGLNTTMRTSTNEVTTTHGNNWVAALEQIPSKLSGSGWEHVVISRFSEGIARVEGMAIPIIQYSYTDLRMDTMRRRMTGATT